MSRQDAVLMAVIAALMVTRLLDWAAAKRALVRWLGLLEQRQRGSQQERRRRARTLAATFGDALDEARIRELVAATFIGKWRETFSLLPTAGELATLKEAEVEGLDRLEAAVRRGRGVILWENVSFGQRLLAPRILALRGFDIVQIHGHGHTGEFHQKPATWVETRLIRPFYERCERPFMADIVYLPLAPVLAFTRAIRSLLDRNAILCIPADGAWGAKRLELELLGFTTQLSTGMLSLARTTGATLLPMFCVRDAAGRPRLVIEHPVEIARGGDREASLARAGASYLALWERYIRCFPELFRGWGNLGPRDEARPPEVA